jgi:TRAP-type C4-dicarboxylate transport system permease small subunit
MNILKKLDKVLNTVLTVISITCFIGIFIIMVFNIFFRWFPILSNIPNFSMGWFDEIIEMLVAWLIFTGAALLSRNQDHFRVDLIQMKLNGKRSLFILETIINIATALFFIALLYYSLNLVIGAVQTTPVLRLQKRWFYLCVPFNSFIITIYTIKNIILNMHKFLTYKKEA